MGKVNLILIAVLTTAVNMLQAEVPLYTMRYAVDFETSLGKLHPYYSDRYFQAFSPRRTLAPQGWDLCTYPLHCTLLKDFLKKLYMQNNLTKAIGTMQCVKIPKIIHQIWLGSPLPEKYSIWQKTWQNIPGFRYKLWTDQDIDEFGLINNKLYQEAQNYGERSDIARYEILYRLGGMYIDVDFACIRPEIFSYLHCCYDFYTGIQPLDINVFALGIGIIASVPRHPILQALLDSLQENQKTSEPIYVRTGPVYFTKIFWQHAGKYGLVDIAFPPTFFYPLGMCQKHTQASKFFPESFAIHYWTASWTLPEACVQL